MRFAIQPRANPGTPSQGMFRVAPGRDPEEVAGRIAALVEGPDVRVMTMAEFIRTSRAFLERESPIAYIFTFGMIMRLVVGVVFVIRILQP